MRPFLILTMNNSLRLTLVFFLFLLFSCKTKKSFVADEYLQGKVFPFLKFDKLEDLEEYAKQNNKCLYLDFYADWCLPCQMMDESLYQDEYLASQFDDFYAAKVDGDAYPELITQYGIRVYPTIVVVGQNGEIIEKNEGVINSKKLLELATLCK